MPDDDQEGETVEEETGGLGLILLLLALIAGALFGGGNG